MQGEGIHIVNKATRKVRSLHGFESKIKQTQLYVLFSYISTYISHIDIQFSICPTVREGGRLTSAKYTIFVTLYQTIHRVKLLQESDTWKHLSKFN